MAGIILTGDTSGTITVNAPAVAGTNTLTLPASTGTVGTVGSGFSAYASTAQTGISNGTFTKMTFTTEEFDINSDYDTSTSRFTPTVAGYYQVTIGAQGATNRSGTGSSFLVLYKNGSRFKDKVKNEGHTNQVTFGVHSTLVSLNGSTDYIEAYVYADNMPSTFNLSGVQAYRTYFQAIHVRGL